MGGTLLHRGEDVFDGDDWSNGIILLVEGIEGSLGGGQRLFYTEHMYKLRQASAGIITSRTKWQRGQ
jgi:hypothetical protein